MPSFKHVIEKDFVSTFRSEKVAGMFDVPVTNKLKKEWVISADFDDMDWQVGLIVGASGSGKTTIAKRLFQDNIYHNGFNWGASTVLDDFSETLTVKEITDALSHVGFSSPPSWLLPYSALSNGQQFRTNVARCLLEYDDVMVFDEFTSVVDRNVAQIGSFAVQKYIRRTNKRFVAVSCHYDINEWLQPDWVLDISANTFTRGCLRRSDIEIEIFQCNYKAWQLFKDHHYLNADINKASTCFVGFINGEPVGFCAVLPFPHPHKKNFWKEHRTVVLPDYQGVGFGNRMSEFCGEWLKAKRKGFITTTSHPSMIGHRIKSDKWALTRKPSRTVPTSRNGIQRKSTSHNRLTASFQYIG
jgi:ABC-type polar amino acid transport system ATPase subunit/GNAT superfamily N-acetyltransferase